LHGRRTVRRGVRPGRFRAKTPRSRAASIDTGEKGALGYDDFLSKTAIVAARATIAR